MNTPLRIDVWSDIVCPYCYIGKRRLETALARSEHADQVKVHWHSFELDPSHPKGQRRPVQETLAEKIGAPVAQIREMTRQVTAMAAEEGLTYALDRAVSVNTFDAHRLNQFASQHGLGGHMHERLMKAHLCEGEVLDDLDTLLRLGVETGLPEEETRQVLHSTRYTDQVNADLHQARRLGITGVPFFVLNNTHAISGAQPLEVFTQALTQVRREQMSTS